MRSSIFLPLLLFLVFRSSLSAISCYGGASSYSSRPPLKEHYTPIINEYNKTEFTDCKEFCFMKRMIDKTLHSSDDVLVSVVGCGDEECKNWDRNSTENSTKTDENGITTTVYCCEGEHCFSEKKVKDFVFETDGHIADYGMPLGPYPTTAPPSSVHSLNHLYFIFLVWIFANSQ